MSRLWAAVTAASFSPVPDEPLARIEWTERPRTSPALWQAPPSARPTWASFKPLSPGRRCPGRLDGELRGLFVRGLGGGADVVAHPGGKCGGQRCARDVTPRDEARRLPVRGCSKPTPSRSSRPLPRAPRASAICERLAGILRRGLLDRDITCFVGGQGRCGSG